MEENQLLHSLRLHKAIYHDSEVYWKEFIKSWTNTGITISHLQEFMREHLIAENITQEEYEYFKKMCED